MSTQTTAIRSASGRGLTPTKAVAALAALCFDDVFNPYSDRCEVYDLPQAPLIRRANLVATFEAASTGVDEVWLGLEPGHRGARRTGLAMTDERRLAAHGRRWNLQGIRRATRDGPETEQTAGIVWEGLAQTQRKVLLWNVFPLHCHNAGAPLSNRRHTRAEWLECRDLLVGVVTMVNPRRIIAIGKEAQRAVSSVGLKSLAVRHPARGGKAKFLTGIAGQ